LGLERIGDPRVVIAELRRHGLIEGATGRRRTVNERSFVPMLEPVNGTQRHFAVPGAGDPQRIASARRISDRAREEAVVSLVMV
jgi:DNA-binding FadR family transcriptional regulator